MTSDFFLLPAGFASCVWLVLFRYVSIENMHGFCPSDVTRRALRTAPEGCRVQHRYIKSNRASLKLGASDHVKPRGGSG